MTLIIWTSLAIIFYAYFGYPVVAYVLGALRNKKTLKKDIYPSVAFLIAAYNEEKDIAQKIENTLRIEYPRDKMRIIVVSDGSTDRTDEIVRAYRNLGVELFRVEGRVGKTEARNQAVDYCTEEILVFSDGTTEYDEQAVSKLLRNFADPSVGYVTGRLEYKKSDKGAMGSSTRLYWAYECLIKRSQTKLSTLTGSVGCISACRRINYKHLPGHIIEDLVEPLMFVQQGFRVVFEEEAIAYEQTTQKVSQELAMRVRVIRGGIEGVLFAKTVLNPFKYPLASFQLIGHKVLRWLIPIFALSTFLSSAIVFILGGEGIYTLLFLGQILFYSMALLGLYFHRIGNEKGLFKIPFFFCLGNYCALKAIYKTLTTNLEATWESKY